MVGRGSAYINGKWMVSKGEDLISFDPSSGDVLWQGPEATETEVQDAVDSCAQAFREWSLYDYGAKVELFNKYKELLITNKDRLSEAICKEVGKPKWEALSEVDSMAAKVDISIKAFEDRCKPIQVSAGQWKGVTRFRPHGVVAVFGPFNFPGHLPNGHIVPALLAGNTVVLKPSELTPMVGELTVELWEEAGLTQGALNLVQGGSRVGALLAANDRIDGLFFTGSAKVGKAIHMAFGGTPGKILALEMGGNNPAVMFQVKDPHPMAGLIAQSAFISSGQRCTCARRLIIPAGSEGDGYLGTILDIIPKIRVGLWNEEPEPFMGPLISENAADAVLQAYDELISLGGEPLIECKKLDGSRAMLAPGVIDVTNMRHPPDQEIFGPLLQVIRVPDFDSALKEANNTAFGLSAGLFSQNRELWDRFSTEVKAGIINWNRTTTGASSAMPFGGVKDSGNHRPSAYFSADYCSYPCASMEQESVTSVPFAPGFPN